MTTHDDLWESDFDAAISAAHRLFTWLSMDRARAFLPLLALPSCEGTALRDACRSYLQAYDCFDLRSDGGPITQRFQSSVEAITATCGADVASTIVALHTSPIIRRTGYAISTLNWVEDLHSVAYDGKIRLAGLSPSVSSAVRDILRSRLEPDLRLVSFAVVEHDAASPWDAAVNGCWEREIGPTASPLDDLRDVVNILDAHRAWRSLELNLEPEDLGAVVTAIRQESRRWPIVDLKVLTRLGDPA